MRGHRDDSLPDRMRDASFLRITSSPRKMMLTVTIHRGRSSPVPIGLCEQAMLVANHAEPPPPAVGANIDARLLCGSAHETRMIHEGIPVRCRGILHLAKTGMKMRRLQTVETPGFTRVSTGCVPDPR